MRRNTVARWLVLFVGAVAGLVALAGVADARQIGLPPTQVGARQATDVGASLLQHARTIQSVGHDAPDIVTPAVTAPTNGHTVVTPQSDGATFGSATSTGPVPEVLSPDHAAPAAVEPVDHVTPSIHDGSGAVAGGGASFAKAGDAFAGAGFGGAFAGTDNTFASAGFFDRFTIGTPFFGTPFIGTPFFGSSFLGAPIVTAGASDTVSPSVFGGGLIQVGAGGVQGLFGGVFGGTLVSIGPGGTQFMRDGPFGGVLLQDGPAGFSLLFGGPFSGAGVSPFVTPNVLGGGLIQFGPGGGTAIFGGLFGGTLFSFSPAGFQLLFGGPFTGLSPLQSEFSSSVGTPITPTFGFGSFSHFGGFSPIFGGVAPGFGVPGIDFTSGFFRPGLDLPGLDLPSFSFFG